MSWAYVVEAAVKGPVPGLADKVKCCLYSKPGHVVINLLWHRVMLVHLEMSVPLVQWVIRSVTSLGARNWQWCVYTVVCRVLVVYMVHKGLEAHQEIG